MNQDANGACRALSLIVVPQGELVLEDAGRRMVHCAGTVVSVMDRSGRTRFDSWKEIANYLKISVRTVQRWEKDEGLPVHRHAHARQDTVYAYTGRD